MYIYYKNKKHVLFIWFTDIPGIDNKWRCTSCDHLAVSARRGQLPPDLPSDLAFHWFAVPEGGSSRIFPWRLNSTEKQEKQCDQNNAFLSIK